MSEFEKQVLERLDEIEENIKNLQQTVEYLERELDDNSPTEDWEDDEDD